MEVFDMMEVLPFIDEKDYGEGRFTHEFYLPDNKSVEISGFVEIFGRMVRDPFLVNDPYFEGTCELTIIEVKAYDTDGTLIEAVNVAGFEKKLNEYLNRD